MSDPGDMSEFVLPHNIMPTPQLWRALRVENIPTRTTPSQLLNLVTTGMVEQLVYENESKTVAELRLMNYSSTVHLYVDWHIRRVKLKGVPLRVTWRCINPVSGSIIKKVAQGASRNVYISNVPKDFDEHTLDDLCGAYGEVESIRVKGRVVFVHFMSIQDAINCVEALKKLQWPDCEINFGHDRCAHIKKQQKQLVALFTGHKSTVLTMDHATMSNTLAQMATAAMTVAMVSGGTKNVGNRTLYLSGFSPGTTLEQICLLGARGGPVQNVKYNAERHTALITFIDPIAAAQFFATWNVQTLVLNDYEVTVDWAKHTPHGLDKSAANLETKATRNVFIGGLGEDFDRGDFRKLMESIGNVAQIHWVPTSACVFVNFADMDCAVTALKMLRNDDKYRQYAVRFAKDRVSSQPRALQHGKEHSKGPYMLQYLSNCHQPIPCVRPYHQLPTPPPEHTF